MALTKQQAQELGWVFENDFAEKLVQTSTGTAYIMERAGSEDELLAQIEGREAHLAARK